MRGTPGPAKLAEVSQPDCPLLRTTVSDGME